MSLAEVEILFLVVESLYQGLDALLVSTYLGLCISNNNSIY
jgi:hypothetical protein